jgi:CRISPR-associated endonuclease/helicase Cas3
MGHAENKREKIEQMTLLLQHVDERGASMRDVAQALEMDESTAHRYRAEIETRYPLEEVSRGRFRLDRTRVLSNVSLSASEALVIYLALRRFIRQTSQSPDFMLSALRKIAPALQRPDLIEPLTTSIRNLQNERPSTVEHEQVWETLIRCWIYSRVVRIRYLSLKSHIPVEHDIEPYLFEPMPFGDTTYLIAWSRTRNDLRTFKPERILQAVELKEPFEKRLSLDIDDLLRQAWGVWYGQPTTRVELLFVPRVARRVMESIYMTGEYKELQADGSLYWAVDIVGTLEILSWIRGWGPEVIVIGPPELKRQMIEELKQSINNYGA